MIKLKMSPFEVYWNVVRNARKYNYSIEEAKQIVQTLEYEPRVKEWIQRRVETKLRELRDMPPKAYITNHYG